MQQKQLFDHKNTGICGTERIAYSVAEASSVSGLGRTTLYSLIGGGRLQSYKIGNRRLIRREDLLALFGKPSALGAN